MNKRQKIILIAAAAVLLAVFGAVYWRTAHAPKRKHVSVKKHAITAAHPAPVVAAKKIRAGVRVAIVIDDFGYNMNNLDALFAIKEPVTLSILPNLPYSRKIAEAARLHGNEIILHLPLESHRKDVREELDTIRTGMTEREVVKRLDEEIASVPGLSGVSNHMGSKATEDKILMTVILKELAGKNLYFSDSLTSDKSVCKDVARGIGERYTSRDMFLDNSNDIPYIEKQLSDMQARALKRGRLVAVCHDRKNTITALARHMPEMAAEGIEFVPLSKLVK